MDRTGSIPFPSNPLPANLAARAYAPRPIAGAPVIARAPRIEHAFPVEPIARIGRRDAPSPDADPARLVAARVQPIDLARDVVQTTGRPDRPGSYALYRHPADRNQAATGVALGRALDVRG